MARITGKDARLYVASGANFIQIGDLYDWEINVEAILFTIDIKGDVWERQIPSHGRGRLTAKRYVQTVLVLANNVINAIVSGTRLDWALISIDPGGVANWSGSTNSKFQGTGYVQRGRVQAPHAPYQDDFELVLDTLPSTFV